jgi:hypothetical protein
MSRNLRAADANNGLIEYESGQDYVGTVQLVNDGDNLSFTTGGDTPWSDAPGRTPVIYPNGRMSGGVITPDVAGKVDVGSTTIVVGGVQVTGSVDALALTIGAAAVGDKVSYSISAYNNAGTIAFRATAGAISAAATPAAFSNTRGAAGGPPTILADDVELGWVRVTIDNDSGPALPVLAEADILQSIPGVHYEPYDSPIWSEDYGSGRVTFVSALPTTHATSTTKKVYATNVYTPQFAPLEPAANFVPAEETHSQSSESVYGGTIGSSSSGLNQASFKVYLRSGYNDAFVALANTRMWVRHYENRLRAAHGLTLGTLGISRTFPADGKIQADCTITADFPTINKAA